MEDVKFRKHLYNSHQAFVNWDYRTGKGGTLIGSISSLYAGQWRTEIFIKANPEDVKLLGFFPFNEAKKEIRKAYQELWKGSL
jgi:hypothetical protein